MDMQRGMWTSLVLALSGSLAAQIGGDGSDGVSHPTSKVVIDTSTRPVGTGPEPLPPQAARAGLRPGEWRAICDSYEAVRHAVVVRDGVYEARNPGQVWRLRFEDGGFLVAPEMGSWTWGLRLRRYGFAGCEITPTRPAHVQADGGRIQYRWDANLEEWYVNDARGLEHGYTLRRRPSRKSGDESGPLTFTLAVRGGLSMAIAEDERGVRFVDQAGWTVLTYTGLTVFDADGRDVPARFEQSGDLLRLLVEEGDARYPLTIDPIAQQAYLKASNTGAHDVFGYCVSVSGDTVVVGAGREGSNATGVNGDQSNNMATYAGAAYVFVRSGSTWTQQAYLKASNTDSGDFFGHSVSISGDTLVVGAWLEDSGATGVNGNQADNGTRDAGAAYVFVRSGSVWTQQAYLKASNPDQWDGFGESVSVSGDTVVVGAHGEDSSARGVNRPGGNNAASDAGAAYVFVRSGGSWSQQAYLKASNTGRLDEFGRSVSASGDSLVVGAPWARGSAGAAYVFVRSGANWTQQAYLKASNDETADHFGESVSISGDTVVVGAAWEDSQARGVNGYQFDNGAPDSGAAYVFARSGGTWKQQAYLKASNTDVSDYFGGSVSVSGDTVVVGARREASNATGVNGNQLDNSLWYAGAAYVFARSGTTWTQKAYLKASNTDRPAWQTTGDMFATSVSVSGDTVVVGAPEEDSVATGVNGDQSSNSAQAAGAVYVFDSGCRSSASSTSVGTGCIATGTPPSLAADPPVQGKSIQLRVGSSLPNAAGVVLLGIQHKGIPLGPKCVAYFDLTLPTVPVFFRTDASGSWISPSIAIGTDPSLSCLEFALQAALDNPPTAPFGMALSNGVWVKIGY